MASLARSGYAASFYSQLSLAATDQFIHANTGICNRGSSLSETFRFCKRSSFATRNTVLWFPPAGCPRQYKQRIWLVRKQVFRQIASITIFLGDCRCPALHAFTNFTHSLVSTTKMATKRIQKCRSISIRIDCRHVLHAVLQPL